MKKFLESRELKKIQIHQILSIVLLSLVVTLKGIFNSANSFQFLECFSIGISAFLISFMGMFANEIIFNDWKEVFNEKSRGEKFFFLIMPIIMLLLILAFNYLFTKLPNFSNYLAEMLDSLQANSLKKIPEIFIYFVTVFWNFLCYTTTSMMISLELTFIGIINFDKISGYYSQIGDKKK